MDRSEKLVGQEMACNEIRWSAAQHGKLQKGNALKFVIVWIVVPGTL